MGLFGGSEDVSLLNGQQKTISRQLKPILMSGIGRGGNQYEGQIVPDLLPQYGQVQNLLGQGQTAGQQAMGMMNPWMQKAVSQTLPGAQVAQNALTNLRNPLMGTLLLGADSTKNMLKSGVMNPMKQVLNDTNMTSSFGGMFGQQASNTSQRLQGDMGTAQNALSAQVGMQNQMANQQVQDQTAQMNLGRDQQSSSMQQALSSMNRQSSLVGSALANQAAMLPLQQAMGIGGTLNGLQAQKQAQNNALYQDWIRTLPENSPWTQLALQYTGMPTQQGAGSSGGLGGMLGGAASGAAVGSVAGPWGTAIGAGVGALAGMF